MDIITSALSTIMQTGPILGRILFGFFFVFFGVWNSYHWTPTLDVMQQKKIILAKPLLFIGIVWESVAGLLIIFGLWTQLAALSLIPFTVISVFIFHTFWHLEGDARRLNMTLFIANLTATLGGLLLLLK